MNEGTVLVFAANGMGSGPEDLQQKLAATFLELMASQQPLPAAICFYTGGVRLACDGSPVLSVLERLQNSGVELILCKTCLDYFNLRENVKVGIVGGMTDIVDCMNRADKVIRL